MCVFLRKRFAFDCTFPSRSVVLLWFVIERKMTNASSLSHIRFFDAEECAYLQAAGAQWQGQYLIEDTFKILVAIIIINSIEVVPTIMLNALVIFSVATRQRLRSKSNTLLACLAGTDVLVGLVYQPLGIAMETKKILGMGPFCTALEKAGVVAFIGLLCASLGHLVLISIDRYIAIKKPLRYQDIVTKQRMTAGVILAWTVALFVTINEIILASIDSKTNIYSVYMNVSVGMMIIFCFMCFATIAYTYFYIFSETRRQKRLQTEHLTAEEAGRIRKDHKAANTLGIILGALAVTYLPSVITVLAATTESIVEPQVLNIMSSWATTFAGLGSLLNPIIYCWRMKKLRQAFLEILHLKQPENSPPAIEMQVIRRPQSQIQPSTSEPFSMSAVKQEPVLLSFSAHLQAVEEIIPLEEQNDQ